MTSTTTSIVTALGSGSGIDMAALAANLATVQFESRINSLTAKTTALTSKISTASSLKSQISSLASALGERVRTGDLAPVPVLSNPAVGAVTRSTSSKPAGTSYSLEVFTLAKAQSLQGPPYVASTSTVGAGTLTLRFGSATAGAFTADATRPAVDIAIAPGAKLADVALAINAANTGVTAYVANSADGARLVFKGQEGANNAFVLEASETPGEEGLTALAWNPAGGDPTRLLAASSDAAFAIDGVAMKSASNKAGEVAPGVSLTLAGTNAGNPATISFNDAAAAVTSVMQDMTSALNEIVTALNAATDPKTGDLARDDGARTLRRQLSSLGSTVIMPGATNGAPKTLAELGLSIGRDGTFSVNTTTLSTALTRDPEGVAAMFTSGLYGVYSTVDKIARAASSTGSPGSLAGSVSRYTTQKTRLSEDSVKIAEKQEALRAQLSKQLTTADTRIGASKSTLSFLQAQVAMWSKSD